jgi:hypothetical protein
MKGNGDFYRSETLKKQKELRKLRKAKNKYQKILEDIIRNIEETEDLIKRDLHCLSVVSSDSEESYIA